MCVESAALSATRERVYAHTQHQACLLHLLLHTFKVAFLTILYTNLLRTLQVLRCHCLNNCARSYDTTKPSEPYHAVPISPGTRLSSHRASSNPNATQNQSVTNTEVVSALALPLGPNQPGTATVNAYFMHPRHGANKTFQVSDVPARVSSIALTISNSLPESYGFGRFATITDVWFDDGSSVLAMEEFTCASTLDDETYVLGARLISPTHAWPPPSDITTGGLGMQGGTPLVNLSSSDPTAVTLAASVAGGKRYVVVTTLANRDAPIDITATATCGGE